MVTIGIVGAGLRGRLFAEALQAPTARSLSRWPRPVSIC